MPFDWNDYARLADELSKREDEASLRTAISRLYYSVYHQARDYLLEENVPLSTTDSSHKVKTYLRMGGSCGAVGRSANACTTTEEKPRTLYRKLKEYAID